MGCRILILPFSKSDSFPTWHCQNIIKMLFNFVELKLQSQSNCEQQNFIKIDLSTERQNFAKVNDLLTKVSNCDSYSV